MISGVQKALISGCRIRSKHGCFQRFFNLFTLWPLSTNIWLVFRYIQQIFFNIPLKSVRYLTKIWSLFSWYPFIIPLISGCRLLSVITWYPMYRFPARCYPLRQACRPYSAADKTSNDRLSKVRFSVLRNLTLGAAASSVLLYRSRRGASGSKHGTSEPDDSLSHSEHCLVVETEPYSKALWTNLT